MPSLLCKYEVDALPARITSVLASSKSSSPPSSSLSLKSKLELPPFAGFIGKLALLKAALTKGHLALVILAVLNSAIAVYYYLGLVREACFRDPEGRPHIVLTGTTRALCVGLMAMIVVLGVAPGGVLDAIAAAAAGTTAPLPAVAVAVQR